MLYTENIGNLATFLQTCFLCSILCHFVSGLNDYKAIFLADIIINEAMCYILQPL